jgi:phospholipase C
VVCGDWVVNSAQPAYQPFYPGTPEAFRLPPLANPTIGERLSAASVDWAWYGGGWSNADGEIGAPGWSNGPGPECSDPGTKQGASFPNCANALFQFHHQPFNYYAAYAPGTAARGVHLRDEAEFSALVKSSASRCQLKAVSFIKPIGAENEHPGYASVSTGSDHLVALLQSITASACAADTMIIVTYDEYGGQWDHIAPPGQGNNDGPHDGFGPGTRVPALIIAPNLRDSFVVDLVSHDTTSIIATLEHRFGVEPLGPRDAHVRDLSSVFDARAPVTVSSVRRPAARP